MDAANMTSRQFSRFVETGRKIVGAARNYREHAAEMGHSVTPEPFFFLKPTSAYITEGQVIKLPPGASEIHHEVELGVVIGERAQDVSEERALDHVAGYCLALDMTDRVAQQQAKKAGHPWSLAKGFDTSCPVSQFIPKDQIPNPQDVPLWLKVNGEMKQSANTRDMVWSTAYLIHWISQRFTLEPGDLILTGTPEGVGPVRPGDVIDCGLGDITQMTFKVEGR